MTTARLITLIMLVSYIAAILIAVALLDPAHAYAPTEDMRPKPRPPMDCWVDENGQIDGCRVKP